jgi:polysaccharide export outer membrane protein
MKMVRGLLFCGFPLAGFIFTSCSSSSNEPLFSDTPNLTALAGSPTSGGAPADVARFHTSDPITVILTGPPDLIPPHDETIKEDGTITLPDIGKVQAAGKTAGELENEIHDLYVPKFYRHLTVTVIIGNRVYYVSGEVKGPGRSVYIGDMTVSQAITSAGDFTDFANHKVWLIRANGERIKVNVDKVRKGKAEDPAVCPGDQITVPRRFW